MASLLLVIETWQLAGRSIIKISGQDPVGYFGTAHSLLFDLDWDLSNEFEVLHPQLIAPLREQPEITGLPGSPFAIGYSLLEVPFLAGGTAVDLLAGRRADGYSQGALTAYLLGNVVFVTIGLLCVHATLRKLGSDLFSSVPEVRREWSSLLVSLALLPATNIGYYALSHLSHASGFMSVALFFWAWSWRRQTDSVKGWIFLGLLGGLATLCRWQNLLLLGAPILSDFIGWKARPLKSLISFLSSRLAYLAAAFAALLPQFAQWKAIYGLYLVNPQGSGFMQFPPRFIPNVLFSSKHGWFLWTPACLLCVAGLMWGSVTHPKVLAPWTVVLGAEVAVIGSIVHYWSGAESFGIRMLACTLPISAVGLFYLLMRASRGWRVAIWGALSFAAAYTVAFAIQYRLDLVPKNDQLTFSELVSDKIFLRRAYERRQVARLCDALLKVGDGNRCAQIANEGIRRFGADRLLLTALVEAERRSGDSEGERRARQRLSKYVQSALW